MPQVTVLDTETSGLSPQDGSALLEVAHVRMDITGAGMNPARTYGVPGTYAAHYVEHAGPIPPEARAIHHIRPEDVAPGSGALPEATVISGLMAAETPDTVYAAHNAEFDRRFLPALTATGLPWICTYRCALHLYPDAPRHGNQVLRYWLGVEPPPAMLEGLAPHRALYDAAVTGALLDHMLKERTVEELILLSNAPAVLRTVRFGKHKGERWPDVDKGYLRWILRNGEFDEDIMHTARFYSGASGA